MNEPKSQRRARTPIFRWVIYLAIVAGIAAWKFVPRPWHPAVHVTTAHYEIASTATRERTEEIGQVVEVLYTAYSNRFHTLPSFKREHPRLRLRLYKDRDELRKVNLGMGWAEAFYRKPYCHAFYSAKEINPYHWMLHEAVHQLNEEVAGINPARWLEEGLAEYFSTSRIQGNELKLGRIDPNTYPVWWIEEIATVPDLATNIGNGSVIPLRAIISNRGGPSMKTEFNRYYLHWWTLTHYVFETEAYRAAIPALLAEGGGVESFEKQIGPIETVQANWHQHVRRLKRALSGSDPDFFRRGILPPE